MINKRLRIQFIWFIALWGVLLSCLSVSWWLNAQWHYGYTQFYEAYSIGEHIDKFAPQNQYVLGLDTLSKAEHVSLFNQISEAVHNHGKGLADISFIVQSSEKKLLHWAEVVHLQDVANLIDKLTTASIVIIVLTALFLAYLFQHKQKPKFKMQLLCLSSLLTFITAFVFIVGPQKIFYQMHIWIFPKGHQWFFYYQESLMSTLMKAPDLFGGIAAAIAVGGLILFALCVTLLIIFFRIRKFR